MSITNTVTDVLHRIRVKLYPSNLPGAKGAFSARIDNEAVLTIDEVCAALKTRGGFSGNYDELVNHVKQFFDEAAYQLCDGFAVNTGYFSIHPAVGGFFNKADDACDSRKNPIRFRFRTRTPLRRLSEHIVIETEKGETNGIIEQFTDMETGLDNKSLSSGGLFTLLGNKIKISGDNPECGLYFVSTGSQHSKIKVKKALLINTSRKVIGVIPSLPAGRYFIEIKTQYTVGGTDLKEPRTVISSFTVKAANAK
ncbi:MAG: DUF4469 domain-containing protein [Treponema sp.]|nr:DUF4469 domain-containing protein [Treponema sp.]